MIRSESGTLIKFDGEKPKYSILENERKWVIDKSFAKRLENQWHFQIVDKYLDNTQIRIRSAIDSETGETIYKFCKKYGTRNPISEPITTTYISKVEYDLLFSLPGKIIKKNRYRFVENGFEFSIDLFIEPELDYLIAEAEESSIDRLNSIQKPSFAIREVTNELEFTGGKIAAKSV